jgi:hypothetical protein
MRDGVKQLLLGLGGEKSLLLDVGLREITAAGRGIARNDCCWMPNMDKSLLLDEGRREIITAAAWDGRRETILDKGPVWIAYIFTVTMNNN